MVYVSHDVQKLPSEEVILVGASMKEKECGLHYFFSAGIKYHDEGNTQNEESILA